MTERTHVEESYDRNLDFALWKKLFRYALAYRRELILLITFGVTTAVFDVLFPLLTKGLIDAVVERGSEANFVGYAMAFAAVTVGLSGSIWFFIRYAGKIRTHVSHDIRRDGFANLQRLSFSFYDHKPVGWLMARMTSDCERLSNIMAWGVLDFFWGTTLMSGIAIAMFLMNAKLAIVVMVVIPFLGWASVFFQKRILGSSRIVRKTNSKLTASYNEAIMGVRTSKVFVREDRNLADFQGLSGEMFTASVRNALQSALFLPIILTLGSVATGLALSVGGLEVAAGSISIGTLIAFLTYTRHFFDPVQEMGHWFAEMQMAQASAERVLSLVEAKPEIGDSPRVEAAIRAHAEQRDEVGRGAAEIAADGLAEDGYPDRIGEIAFRGVGFVYEGGERVLEDFELRVAAGETIALVGPTGGGKSTIVSLLCRFYEPTEGSIELDGVDYRERGLHWLQSKLGIVLQQPHLFSGSVESNIRYGKLDATDEEIRTAASVAGAHHFVSGLEHGYETEVGEGGNLLSTGQKQLVSFARAILARPEILVMDEATSSIDTETEQQIQRGLAHVLEGRTSFVIAHRLSTIRSADRILVIEKGRIEEEGPHAELMARRGHYYSLYTQQSLRESVRFDPSWVGRRPAGGDDLAPAGAS